MRNLTVEVNPGVQVNRDLAPGIMITPSINPEYWLFRVAVSKSQAIVGFPKFCVIGVGFQHEEEWNTNLPSSCDAEEIYDHIKPNAGPSKPSKAKCLEAIRAIQAAVIAARTSPGERDK